MSPMSPTSISWPMSDYAKPEEWQGERALIDGYVRAISKRLISRNCRWQVKASGAAAAWFNAIAPPSLMA
jgi:hypothetical protein